MNTQRFIDALVRDLAPVPPLASPWTRAMWWLFGAVAYLSAITLTMASPAEVATNGRDGRFVFYQLAGILTAASAAAAAFASTVPGHSGRSVRFAVFAAIVTLGTLSIGAVGEWTRREVNLATPGEWGCVAMIIVGGALPYLLIARMLRRGAPLTPALTAGMGALASTSLASVGACLSHPHPSDSVMLVWHGSTIFVAVVIAAVAGHATLNRNTPRPH